MRSYLAVLAVALIPLASCGAGRRTDPELEMVRAYLRENLDEPVWEEVKWWPGRDLTERKAEAIAEYREKLADAEERLQRARAGRQAVGPLQAEVDRWRESLKNAEAAKPRRVCRLKYRVGAIGGRVLVDEVFVVEGKRVRPADELLPGYPGYWKQYFDDKQSTAKPDVAK